MAPFFWQRYLRDGCLRAIGGYHVLEMAIFKQTALQLHLLPASKASHFYEWVALQLAIWPMLAENAYILFTSILKTRQMVFLGKGEGLVLNYR